MLILISIIIVLAYLILIACFIIGFDRVKLFEVTDILVKTKFSIIIPFRNEAERLPSLLHSILKLKYPKQLFEVILINDESTDDSVKIISNFKLKHNDIHIKTINNKRVSNSPKKDAINLAIQYAKHNWIATTDADCVIPNYWLNSFDSFIQTHRTKFIAAPVTYYNINSGLKRFQILDLFSLIGATIGGFGINKPFLCNGANLAYKKSFFHKLNGFKGNTNIASGDDIFLLEKAIKADPKSVHFLKTIKATVLTEPQLSFKNLMSQRVRWAAKTAYYKNTFAKLTGIIVLIMNTLIVFLLVLTAIGNFQITILAYIFIIKSSIDFLLIFKTARFFSQEKYLSFYILSAFFYPPFSVYVAIVSIFKNYSWKGRLYSK